MSAPTTDNVRNLYFEHKDLSCINIKPTFESLQNMLLQLKANCSLVLTSLGGGVHVYVDAILCPVTYTTLDPVTPFIGPARPGLLQVVVSATHYNIALTKSQHKEAHKTFVEYQLV